MILQFIFDVLINLLQLFKLKERSIPKECKRFESIWKVDIEAINKSKEYNYEKKCFHLINGGFSMVISILSLAYGLYPITWNFGVQISDNICKDSLLLSVALF